MDCICEIDMKLPSLNEYICECRSNRFQAAKMKREIESQIAVFIWRIPKFQRPVYIQFHWTEENRKRDLDNVAFGKKFVLDALVKYGKLANDGRKNVVGFKDTFELGERAKVTIAISEV